jgi:hypothetical protein
MLKKTIPAVFALILLLTGALAGVMFLDQDTGFLPRAAPEYLPNNVRLTNLSANTISISWTTKEPTTGFIKIGENPDALSYTYTDDRDQLTGNNDSFRTHHVTVSNLMPDSIYYYTIGSYNNSNYDNNGEPFSITTPSEISQPTSNQTITGSVLNPAQTVAEGALVYLVISDSSPLSTLVNQNGTFAFDLSILRNQDLTPYDFTQISTTNLNLLVSDGSNPATFIETPFELDLANPIIIGQSQTLQKKDQLPTIDVEPTPIPISKFSFEQIEVTEQENDSSISVDSIPEDNYVTSETQPVFEGTAPANQSINITIHSSTQYSDTATTNEFGEWEWQPPGELEPGDHELSVSYVDEEGILHAYTRTFVIASATADTNSPLYTSTPSATIQPQSTPTPDVTIIPTQIPSPTPKEIVGIPATTSAIPVSGHASRSIILTSIGVIFIFLGLAISKRTI